ETKYKSVVFAELPDGRVMLSAWSCRIYTTREKILAIPYPVPPGYLESVGSTNYTVAIKQYREYLAAQDEDEKYKPMLKNAFSTRPADHDGGKVE
ncbi:MAG: hypothetical protein SCH66_14900, partial [Methanolobus sp.]|nr:hypothetical protein [Methanolobus sp.]